MPPDVEATVLTLLWAGSTPSKGTMEEIEEIIAGEVAFNDWSDMELESALLIAESIIDALNHHGYVIVKKDEVTCKLYSCEIRK